MMRKELSWCAVGGSRLFSVPHTYYFLSNQLTDIRMLTLMYFQVCLHGYGYKIICSAFRNSFTRSFGSFVQFVVVIICSVSVAGLNQFLTKCHSSSGSSANNSFAVRCCSSAVARFQFK